MSGRKSESVPPYDADFYGAEKPQTFWKTGETLPTGGEEGSIYDNSTYTEGVNAVLAEGEE